MKPEQILEAFTIADDDTLVGIPCAYLVLGFTDFKACRLPLIDVFAKICIRMGEQLLYYSTHTMKQFRKVDGAFADLFGAWFSDPYREPSDGGEYGVEAHSGDHPQGTGSWGMKFSVQPWSLDYEAGTMALHLPIEHAYDGTLEAVAREIAEVLPLRSACAGLAVASNSGYPTVHAGIMAEWSMRYHGLLPHSPIGARYALHDGVLTPAWITIIDAQLAQTCGPTDALAEAGVHAETIEGLTFLRAGSAPTLADSHGDRSDVAPYQALHRYLRPVLFTEAEHLYLAGFDDEMLERWMTRFQALSQ